MFLTCPKQLKFKFWDVPGLESDDEGMPVWDQTQIGHLLDGAVPVSWKLGDETYGERDLKNSIHAVVFVVHAGVQETAHKREHIKNTIKLLVSKYGLVKKRKTKTKKTKLRTNKKNCKKNRNGETPRK